MLPPASEVMSLALQFTGILADVYGMIADMAESIKEPSNNQRSTRRPASQRQIAALLKIAEATEQTETQLRLLDSQTIIERSEILESFLEDCWTALLTFREVCGRLAAIIGLDGWGNPSAAASETLAQIMEQLQTCSEKVSDLPDSALAVSFRRLAGPALNLPR